MFLTMNVNVIDQLDDIKSCYDTHTKIYNHPEYNLRENAADGTF